MAPAEEALADIVEMAEACARMALRPFYDAIADRLDQRAWTDPYMLGVVHGMVSGQCVPLLEAGLGEADIGMVMMEVLSRIGADEAVFRFSAELIGQHDTSFIEGHHDATVATSIMIQRLPLELENDPSVITAKANASLIHESISLPPDIEMEDHLAHAISFLLGKTNAHWRVKYLN